MSLTLGLTFIDCTNPYAGVVLLAIGVGSFGFASGGGFLANINEIGGSFAGMLFGLQNTVATIPGIIAPYLVGVITTHVSFDKFSILWTF
jgi:MFS transporter, ACS family, solute carrier family 17 (sodium-dependent inorganic phosphate cotransporter), member 5